MDSRPSCYQTTRVHGTKDRGNLSEIPVCEILLQRVETGPSDTIEILPICYSEGIEATVIFTKTVAL